MISELLSYTWKGVSGYSYGYILVGNKSKKKDIIKDKRTKVLWGGGPNTFSTKCVLNKAGITNLLSASVFEKGSIVTDYYNGVDYRKILNNAKNYYHIIDLSTGFNGKCKFTEGKEVFKLLQYAGIDDFSIVFSDFTKDFSGRKKLQEAFFSSLQEVYFPVSFLGNWDVITDCKMYSLEGAGYWDVLSVKISGFG